MSDTRSFYRGDVVLVPFPFITDFSQSKPRPVLVVQNDVGNRYSLAIPCRRTAAKSGHSSGRQAAAFPARLQMLPDVPRQVNLNVVVLQTDE